MRLRMASMEIIAERRATLPKIDCNAARELNEHAKHAIAHGMTEEPRTSPFILVILWALVDFVNRDNIPWGTEEERKAMARYEGELFPTLKKTWGRVIFITGGNHEHFMRSARYSRNSEVALEWCRKAGFPAFDIAPLFEGETLVDTWHFGYTDAIYRKFGKMLAAAMEYAMPTAEDMDVIRDTRTRKYVEGRG